MNRTIISRRVVVTAALFLCAIFLLAQPKAPAKKTLLVNGRPVPDALVQMNGHYYVDIEALAKATQASLIVLPERISLDMRGATAQQVPVPKPAAPAPAPPPPTPQPQPPKDGITKDFARAAINHLGLLRDWREAVIGTIKAGRPADSTLQGFRERAVESLRLASVAASTSSDHSALQLMRGELSSTQQWIGSALTANKHMDGEKAVNPDFPENDDLLSKISDCNNFLSGMITSGVFADSQTCH